MRAAARAFCFAPFTIILFVTCCLALALCAARHAMRAASTRCALLRPLHDYPFCSLLSHVGDACNSTRHAALSHPALDDHLFCRLLSLRSRVGAVCCQRCKVCSSKCRDLPPSRSIFLLLAVSRWRCVLRQQRCVQQHARSASPPLRLSFLSLAVSRWRCVQRDMRCVQQHAPCFVPFTICRLMSHVGAVSCEKSDTCSSTRLSFLSLAVSRWS